MKYVLDASVAVCIALPTAMTPKAQRLLDDYVLHVHALLLRRPTLPKWLARSRKASVKSISVGVRCSTVLGQLPPSIRWIRSQLPLAALAAYPPEIHPTV